MKELQTILDALEYTLKFQSKVARKEYTIETLMEIYRIKEALNKPTYKRWLKKNAKSVIDCTIYPHKFRVISAIEEIKNGKRQIRATVKPIK